MRIKICGVTSSKDLKIAVDAGADAVGFLVGQLHASPDFILPSTAARLAKELPPFVAPVIVTHLVDTESIIEMLRKTAISTVQLHGGSTAEDVKKIRNAVPPTCKIILAVHMMAGKKIDPDFHLYTPYVDAFLLDSFNKTGGQVGGTGRVHDWDRSAEIVRESKLPVILAGGLTPENVADAIRKVKPYGVDANSGLKEKDGSRSPELCKAFVANACKAFLL